MFVGRRHRSLSELDEIQRLSDLGGCAVPEEYNVMRRDYSAWWRSLLERSVKQDKPHGAEVARKNNPPMWFTE